ncbi:MAG: hypothetical protein LBB58_02030 [Cellulomonadaceae bacterium]|jgi:hypothetical protein|nr:hypothetical protein [Cellulomonadaceae bacterium]
MAAFWFWAAVATFAMLVLIKQKSIALITGVPFAVLWLTAIASPGSGMTRLLYGIILALPVLIAVGLSGDKPSGPQNQLN